MGSQKKTIKNYHKKRKSEEAPICPYCGRRSVLRPAEYVYGEDTIDRGSMLFVCSGYPSCKAYVGVHEGTRKPKGILADSELRNKRIRAHRALDAVVKTGRMSKDGVYIWLSSRLNIPYKQTHIGYFSDYLCDQTIKECEGVLANWRTGSGKRAA
ncbi:MAG: zinc-finger-containing protein [Monoglobales bacterium]